MSHSIFLIIILFFNNNCVVIELKTFVFLMLYSFQYFKTYLNCYMSYYTSLNKIIVYHNNIMYVSFCLKQ